jgi:hypothetical protein
LCAALCDADAEPSLQRGVQPVLVVGLESVCRPGDVAVGPDQHPADLKVGGGTGHDLDAIRPSACGFTHMSAGQVEQYWARPVKQFGYPSAIVEGDVGRQAPPERMVVAYGVVDVGAGEEVCHVFGDTR